MRAAALAAELVAMLALVGAVLERRRPGRFPLADLLGDLFRPPFAREFRPATVAGALAAGAALALLPQLCFAGFGWVSAQATDGPTWSWCLLAVTTLALKLLWAALEEIVFRGALFLQAARRLGVLAGLTVSALLFALAHAPRAGAGSADGLALAVRALDGATYGILFAATGNLWAPVLAHAAKNIGIWLATSDSSLQLADGFRHVRSHGPPLWAGTEHGSGLVEVLVAAGVLAAVAVTAGRRVWRRPAGASQPDFLQKALR